MKWSCLCGALLLTAASVMASPLLPDTVETTELVQASVQIPPPVTLKVSANKFKASDPSSGVTLTLQSDVSRLHRATPLAAAWQGPISFAVLTKQGGSDVQEVEKFWESADPNVRKHVTIHLCEAQAGFEYYPINVMRNHAMHLAATEWIYVLDVDEQVVGTMQEHLAEVNRAEGDLRAPSPVYAVQSFQWSGKGFKLPRSQNELKDMMAKGIVGRKAPHSPGYNPLDVDVNDVNGWMALNGAKETTYRDAYEPYFIARRSQVLDFDPRFVGWGGNKHIETLEMAMQGYTFALLPHVFSFADENPKTKSHAAHADFEFVKDAFAALGERYGCSKCSIAHCVADCGLPKTHKMMNTVLAANTPLAGAAAAPVAAVPAKSPASSVGGEAMEAKKEAAPAPILTAAPVAPAAPEAAATSERVKTVVVDSKPETATAPATATVTTPTAVAMNTPAAHTSPTVAMNAPAAAPEDQRPPAAPTSDTPGAVTVENPFQTAFDQMVKGVAEWNAPPAMTPNQ